jgi:hypothetical protein
MRATNIYIKKEPLLNSNETNNNNINNKKYIDIEDSDQELSKKGRNIVFILYLISNILISMDHGSIPA